ncbi:hypothetical protein ACFV1Q_01030, partial [Streptomyces sp. NPDC059604]
MKQSAVRTLGVAALGAAFAAAAAGTASAAVLPGNAAFGRAQGYECPNSQATLGNVQDGLYWAGV